MSEDTPDSIRRNWAVSNGRNAPSNVILSHHQIYQLSSTHLNPTTVKIQQTPFRTLVYGPITEMTEILELFMSDCTEEVRDALHTVRPLIPKYSPSCRWYCNPSDHMEGLVLLLSNTHNVVSMADIRVLLHHVVVVLNVFGQAALGDTRLISAIIRNLCTAVRYIFECEEGKDDDDDSITYWVEVSRLVRYVVDYVCDDDRACLCEEDGRRWNVLLKNNPKVCEDVVGMLRGMYHDVGAYVEYRKGRMGG
eukprot:PhF_6_TR8669/c0_g1_i1/m.13559